MKKLFSNTFFKTLFIIQLLFIPIFFFQYISSNALEQNISDNKLLLSSQYSNSNDNFISLYSANIPQNKIAYLTFDDGPSTNTEKILKILDDYNIKATFFVTGASSQSGLKIYKTIASKGHSLGNHTFSHNYSKIYKSKDAFISDFKKLEDYLNNSIGVSTNIVRLPGGSNNTVSHKYGGNEIMVSISKYLIDNGYTYFDWNVDSTDACVKTQDKDKIVSSVLNRSKNKNAIIVLMHDGPLKTSTVDALPEIIEGLKKQGFNFKPLSCEEYVTQFLRAK